MVGGAGVTKDQVPCFAWDPRLEGNHNHSCREDHGMWVL